MSTCKTYVQDHFAQEDQKGKALLFVRSKERVNDVQSTNIKKMEIKEKVVNIDLIDSMIPGKKHYRVAKEEEP